ncbi:MAG TPA: ATP-binding protein [Acidimicrobiales bacterium]
MPRHPQRSGQSTHPFSARFDAHVAAVPETRRRFVDWMRTAALEDEAVEDLEVVFSEVAANAVAASPSPSDEVHVLAQLDETVLVLEVSNRTDALEELPLVAPDLDDPLRPNGRGLLIARAFVDSVDIETAGPDRLVVRCCKRVSRAR